MKRIVVAAMASILFALILAGSSYAHVLVRDTSGSKGAILHIIPDDDPIAGKKATLYFDAQDVFDDDVRTGLSITRDDNGEAVVVETKRDGSLVTAEYIFPARGVYNLR